MAGGFGQRAETSKRSEGERARGAWLISADLAAKAVGADVRQVMQTTGRPGRGSNALTTRARKIACYVAMVAADVPPMALSRAAGINHATLNAHGAWVEDERERDAGFDRLVGDIEEALLRMAARIVMARLTDRPEPLGTAA